MCDRPIADHNSSSSVNHHDMPGIQHMAWHWNCAWVGRIKTFAIFCSRVLYLTCYLQLSPIYLFLNRMAWHFSHITCVLYTSVSTEQFWRNLICFPLPITVITAFSKTCFVRHLLSSHEPRLVISSKNGLKLLIHHLHYILASVYSSFSGNVIRFDKICYWWRATGLFFTKLKKLIW